jgi:cell division septation protein DedD
VPDPINPTAADRARRSVLETPPVPRSRPTRSRFLLVGLPLFAVFAAFAAIIWLAYEHGAEGPLVGEPPLVRAPTVALKLAPDDDSASAAEDGGVVDMLSEAQPADQLERLLPPPEEPLMPLMAESATETPEESSPPASEVAEATPPAAEAAEPPGVEPPPSPTVAATSPAPEVAATSPAPAVAAPTPAPKVAAVPPAPPQQAPPPVERQSAAAAPPAPPASQPQPSLDEAEATLDALLAEVTELNEQQAATPPPPVSQTARVEPVAPRPSASEVRPAVAPPTAQPAPPAVPRLTQPGGEVTASERDQRPSSSAAARPGARPPVVEAAPGRSELAALTGEFRIQLAAVREEADARRAWDLFLVDLGPVLSGLQPYIERADTANGVFYRVQVGPFTSLQAAESLCDELKQRNASCFVIRR